MRSLFLRIDRFEQRPCPMIHKLYSTMVRHFDSILPHEIIPSSFTTWLSRPTVRHLFPSAQMQKYSSTMAKRGKVKVSCPRRQDIRGVYLLLVGIRGVGTLLLLVPIKPSNSGTWKQVKSCSTSPFLRHTDLRTWTFGSGMDVPHQQVGALFTSSSAAPLVSLSLSGALNYLDPSSEKPIRLVSGHQKTINALGTTPDSKTVFTGSYDGRVCAWDVAEGTAEI